MPKASTVSSAHAIMKGPVTSHFLNVDLEVTARGDLAPLVAALRNEVIVVNERRSRGLHSIGLELYASSRFTDPRHVSRSSRGSSRLSRARRDASGTKQRCGGFTWECRRSRTARMSRRFPL